MIRGSRTGLFHAVVGLGLASCGGMASTSKDAGPTGMASDATSVGSSGGARDATLMAPESAAPDASSYDALANDDAAADAVAALDATFDAHPDVVWIIPVQ
jgi:hypothetical protein